MHQFESGLSTLETLHMSIIYDYVLSFLFGPGAVHLCTGGFTLPASPGVACQCHVRTVWRSDTSLRRSNPAVDIQSLLRSVFNPTSGRFVNLGTAADIWIMFLYLTRCRRQSARLHPFITGLVSQQNSETESWWSDMLDSCQLVALTFTRSVLLIINQNEW